MRKTVRPTWAEIDLGAIDHNVREIAKLVAPAEVCAIVKAYGYGHGLVRVSETAIRAGATRIGVALVEEGRALRHAGIEEPILVLSGPFVQAPDEVVTLSLTPSLYTIEAVEAVAAAARRFGVKNFLVHVKVDSGMNRVGVPHKNAMSVIRAVHNAEELFLEGLFTHFSVADEPTNPHTKKQLENFLLVLEEVEKEFERPPIVHAANSAASMAFPEARFDMVRPGIAIYGIPPARGFESFVSLAPAMSLKSRVTFVKRVDAGQVVSYGNHYETKSETTLASFPIGYADGVPRRLGLTGGEVLINEKRFPIAGTVTMDQLVVDCGDEQVSVGDVGVILGTQGNESITAQEWADRLDDIPFIVPTGVSSRVPRRYVTG